VPTAKPAPPVAAGRELLEAWPGSRSLHLQVVEKSELVESGGRRYHQGRAVGWAAYIQSVQVSPVLKSRREAEKWAEAHYWIAGWRKTNPTRRGGQNHGGSVHAVPAVPPRNVRPREGLVVLDSRGDGSIRRLAFYRPWATSEFEVLGFLEEVWVVTGTPVYPTLHQFVRKAGEYGGDGWPKIDIDDALMAAAWRAGEAWEPLLDWLLARYRAELAWLVELFNWSTVEQSQVVTSKRLYRAFPLAGPLRGRREVP
jgi:hypothetical protein